MRDFTTRWLPATVVLVLTALACLATGSPQAAALAFVGGGAALLAAATLAEPLPRYERRDQRARDEPGIASLIEAVAQPVLVLADSRVEHANRAARTVLGGHIVGENARVAIRHPAAAERLTGSLADAEPLHLVGLGGQDAHWRMHVTDVGRWRIVHLIDETGAFAAERMRVDFVANASHELRTPLASILGYIETLADEAGDDPGIRARFLRIMQIEAERMQRLVADLISLSRIEADKYRLPDAPVDLGAITAETVAEMRQARDDAEPRLTAQIAPTPPIAGDAAQLSQMLHNLIGNALKYGRAGGAVRVSVQPQGERMVRLSIADEGDGIAPEHLPRLTERFYRADPGRSRAAGGTGLGLAIVKHIVERHRGRLDIASVPGAGTTVMVTLPITEVTKL